MRTIEFPYFIPSFPEYNVAQSAVIPFIDQDVNLVVSFGTAVGKTVLAECCFGYHLETDENCRVAYVSPYRSLSAEKHEDWCNEPQFASKGVMLSTGDSPADHEDFMENRIAVITSESFDSKTRTSRYRAWLESLACIVFDEAHMIGDKTRGGAVESSMMRITELNPSVRLVLLSATMGNSIDVAKWVKSLNGKSTKCIESDWTPSNVEVQYHEVNDGFEGKTDKAIELVLADKSKGKTIVFVHSKVMGRDIVKRLKKAGVRSAFHNASLTKAKRIQIEKAFDNEFSGLDVLVSTSTLGAGVNVGM